MYPSISRHLEAISIESSTGTDQTRKSATPMHVSPSHHSWRTCIKPPRPHSPSSNASTSQCSQRTSSWRDSKVPRMETLRPSSQPQSRLSGACEKEMLFLERSLVFPNGFAIANRHLRPVTDMQDGPFQLDGDRKYTPGSVVLLRSGPAPLTRPVSSGGKLV